MRVIVFSKNRALQLQACIESFLQNINGYFDLNVLYTCDKNHEASYKELIEEYPGILFTDQKEGFKNALLNLLGEHEPTTMIVVDDTIFIRAANSEFLRALILDESSNPCSIPLYLSSNVTACYSYNCLVKNPALQSETKQFVYYCAWEKQEYDFGYPLCTIATVYKTSDLRNWLSAFDFIHPNSLEQGLVDRKELFCANRPMIFFSKAIAVCLAQNLVQPGYNRFGNKEAWHQDVLLQKFTEGKSINFSSLQNTNPTSSIIDLDLPIL